MNELLSHLWRLTEADPGLVHVLDAQDAQELRTPLPALQEQLQQLANQGDVRWNGPGVELTEAGLQRAERHVADR